MFITFALYQRCWFHVALGTLTCNHSCQVHQPHSEPFVDHFQGNTQNELHNKIPQDVLNSAETNTVVKYSNPGSYFLGRAIGIEVWFLVKDLLNLNSIF